MRSSIKPAFMICILLLNTYILSAQLDLDFSGTWILDHSKSDQVFRDVEVTVVITQTEKTFSVEQIIFMKNGEKSATPAVTYNLDGKEVIKEEQGGKDRSSAILSSNRKTLTIKFVRTMNGKDFGSITVYKLSHNAQFLTINSSDLSGGSPMVQVYRKK